MPGNPLTACLVCSWIRPAIAMEPPDGISSVVSARRVLIEGIVVPATADRFKYGVFGRDFRHLGHHPQADPPLGQHHRREVERDAEFLVADDLDRTDDASAVIAWQVTPAGIGNSPPAMNVADSPEIAVRFGSASVRTTPALSIARSGRADRRQTLGDARDARQVVADQRAAEAR